MSGVVTFSQQCNTLGPSGRSAGSLSLSFHCQGNQAEACCLALGLEAGTNTQVSGESPGVAAVLCLEHWAQFWAAAGPGASASWKSAASSWGWHPHFKQCPPPPLRLDSNCQTYLSSFS